jgi:16S rRNA (uracil1498-N3)-methyltransferase
MFLFYQPGIPEGVQSLDADESRHCVKVLRKKSGEAIVVTDGKGFFYDVTITQADAARCTFNVIARRSAPEKKYSVRIAISPTKNADRTEWFVEKATEIGVDHITLLECRNSERTNMKTARLVKVAISAMKQSLKATLPRIDEEIIGFTDLLQQSHEEEKCIAYVDDTNPLHLRDAVARDRSCIVLIGPEGDFSPEELHAASAQGFKKVSLGPSRLRTETAGLVACHTLNLLNLPLHGSAH